MVINSEDITFCMNRKCRYLKCERNPKNIKHLDIPHSFAELEYTDDCIKGKVIMCNNGKRI